MSGELQQGYQEYQNISGEGRNKTTQDIYRDPQLQAFLKTSPERDRVLFNLELAQKDLAIQTNNILQEFSSTLGIPMPTSSDARGDASIGLGATLGEYTHIGLNRTGGIHGVAVDTRLPLGTHLGVDYGRDKDGEALRVSAERGNWAVKGDISNLGQKGVVSFHNDTTSADMTVVGSKNMEMKASSVTSDGTKFNIDYAKQGDEERGNFAVATPLDGGVQANIGLGVDGSSRSVNAGLEGPIRAIPGATFFGNASIEKGSDKSGHGNGVSVGVKIPL